MIAVGLEQGTVDSYSPFVLDNSADGNGEQPSTISTAASSSADGTPERTALPPEDKSHRIRANFLVSAPATTRSNEPSLMPSHSDLFR